MQRKIYILSVCLILSLGLIQAQNPVGGMTAKMQRTRYNLPQVEELGESILECIYSHLAYDPVLKSTKEFEGIFCLTSNGRTYYNDYVKFVEDSIFHAIGETNVTWRDADSVIRVTRNYKEQGNSIILRNFQGPELLTERTRIFGANYSYHEPLPLPMKWEETLKTDTICGYLCQQAVCTFRGRTWTVWYAPEIPVPYGPWKLEGLPGLILKAEDATGEHLLEAMVIRKPAAHQIAVMDRKYFPKTKRQKVYELNKRYRQNPQGLVSASSVNIDTGHVVKRLFYSPLELTED